MMAPAMVAQIQPQNIEPTREQFGAERDDVTGVNAAFPAVQHDRDTLLDRFIQPLGRPYRCPPSLRQTQKSLQPNAVAAVEQPLSCAPEQRRAASAREPLHWRQVANY